MSYQPASLDGTDNQDSDYQPGRMMNYGQWDGGNQDYNEPRYTQPPNYTQPQTYTQPQGYNQPGSMQTTMTDQSGRRYRCYCVPIDPPRPRPRPGVDLNAIARIITGRNLNDALRIYPNIRVVIRDGQRLPVIQDYRRDRINVETRNNNIVRVVGFY